MEAAKVWHAGLAPTAGVSSVLVLQPSPAGILPWQAPVVAAQLAICRRAKQKLESPLCRRLLCLLPLHCRLEVEGTGFLYKQVGALGT